MTDGKEQKYTVDETTIINAVHTALNARESIDKDTHQIHHQFVSEMIDRAHRRRDTIEKVKQQAYGYGVITAIGGLGYALLEWLKKVK